MKLKRDPHPGPTENHWYWRPGWGPGRRMYTFHLTWEQAPDRAAVPGLAG